MLDVLNRVKEQWALYRRPGGGNANLAMFIHGFRGSYLTTWGGLAQMLKEHAEAHQVLGEWDYLFLGYDTWNVETYLDIARIMCSEWDRAKSGAEPYGHPYTRLA